MNRDERLDSFNAEQRERTHVSHLAFDYTIDLPCPDCHARTPSGQLAAHGLCCVCLALAREDGPPEPCQLRCGTCGATRLIVTVMPGVPEACHACGSLEPLYLEPHDGDVWHCQCDDCERHRLAFENTETARHRAGQE